LLLRDRLAPVAHLLVIEPPPNSVGIADGGRFGWREPPHYRRRGKIARRGGRRLGDSPLRARLWAVLAIFGAFAADRAVKRLLLSGAVEPNGTTLIPGVANISFTWNQGVSFGLLWPNSDLGALLLSAAAVFIVVALLIWAFRAGRTRLAVTIGLIIGGALSNLVDRYLYGAVFDFLAMRLGGITLFVCNLADISITLGTCGLVIDSLMARTS
jgi:signal peptidase II